MVAALEVLDSPSPHVQELQGHDLSAEEEDLAIWDLVFVWVLTLALACRPSLASREAAQVSMPGRCHGAGDEMFWLSIEVSMGDTACDLFSFLMVLEMLG